MIFQTYRRSLPGRPHRCATVTAHMLHHRSFISIEEPKNLFLVSRTPCTKYLEGLHRRRESDTGPSKPSGHGEAAIARKTPGACCPKSFHNVPSPPVVKTVERHLPSLVARRHRLVSHDYQRHLRWLTLKAGLSTIIRHARSKPWPA